MACSRHQRDCGAAGGFAGVDYPKHARQEAVAPVRPGFACMVPAAGDRVQGIEIGMPLDEGAQLAPGESQGVFKQGGAGGA